MVDVAEILGAGGAYLSEEAPDHARMSNDGLRRQPTFSPHIVGELREYLVLWSDPRWLRWRDDRDCQIVCVRGFRDGGARFVVSIESEASEAWSARLLGCSKRSSPKAA